MNDKLKEVHEKLQKHTNKMLVGTLLAGALLATQPASAQNSSAKQNAQELLASQKHPGQAYINLASKVWEMYQLSIGGFSHIDSGEKQKCHDFFEQNRQIRDLCQQTDEKIGAIRGPHTINSAEKANPQYRDDLYAMLADGTIRSIDGVGDVKADVDQEETSDIVWRMYTYVATHGGLRQKNNCSDFFKKYPELYDVCQTASVALDGKISLERSTYSDIMHYNIKNDQKINQEDWNKRWDVKDFDERVDLAISAIKYNTGISKREMETEIRDIKIPDHPSSSNTLVLGQVTHSY